MIHELCVKLQHAEEDIEMKRETIQKQSCDLEEKVKREGSLEQDIKVHVCQYHVHVYRLIVSIRQGEYK